MMIQKKKNTKPEKIIILKHWGLEDFFSGIFAIGWYKGIIVCFENIDVRPLYHILIKHFKTNNLIKQLRQNSHEC